MTILEVIVTLAISIIVAMGVAAAIRISANATSTSTGIGDMSANARNRLAELHRDITSSNTNYVNIKPCALNECLGEKILYKEAVEDQTSVAGTSMTPAGKMKVGANGKQYCYWQYMVNMQNRLVKTLQCHNCGNGVCAGGEDVNNCPWDCGSCGDAVCSEERDETVASCPQDCHRCGDGICGPGESCTGASACPVDCDVGDCSLGVWEW